MKLFNQEETKVKTLLKELSDNREKLHDMLGDITGFRATLDKLLPKQVDYKSKWMIPERIRTVTEVIKSELAVRKQIDESVKTEIELRRKSGDESREQLAGDIKNMAKAIEFLEQKNECESKLEDLEENSNNGETKDGDETGNIDDGRISATG